MSCVFVRQPRIVDNYLSDRSVLIDHWAMSGAVVYNSCYSIVCCLHLFTSFCFNNYY